MIPVWLKRAQEDRGNKVMVAALLLMVVVIVALLSRPRPPQNDTPPVSTVKEVLEVEGTKLYLVDYNNTGRQVLAVSREPLMAGQQVACEFGPEFSAANASFIVVCH